MVDLLYDNYAALEDNFQTLRWQPDGPSPQYETYLGHLAALVAATDIECDVIVPLAESWSPNFGINGDLRALARSNKLPGMAPVLDTVLRNYDDVSRGSFHYDFYRRDSKIALENAQSPLIIESVRKNENRLAGLIKLFGNKKFNVLTIADMSSKLLGDTATDIYLDAHEIAIDLRQGKHISTLAAELGIQKAIDVPRQSTTVKRSRFRQFVPVRA
jgi:hypothetical protein